MMSLSEQVCRPMVTMFQDPLRIVKVDGDVRDMIDIHECPP